MILQKIGILFKKNTKTKLWWAKLAISLVLSNIFFFILFSDDSKSRTEFQSGIPEGWVEVEFEAQLLTPFQTGKKVLIVQRSSRKKLEGVLQAPGSAEHGRMTVLVRETEASALFLHHTWEVLPYLKNLTFASIKKEQAHEIRY